LGQVRLNSYGHCNRKGIEIGDTYVEGADAQKFGAAFSIAMQGDGGASAAQLHDFHFAPGDAVDACAKGFADGLFGSEATGETRGLATALAYFHLSEDAFQEALAVMFVDFAHAIYLDDVDTNSNIHALWRT
jgi:hypothetical protein